MSDESKNVGGVVSAIFSILNKDAKEFISMFVFMLTPVILMICIQWAYNAATSAKKVNVKCWELQEIQGKTFKFNACTGEIQELDKKFSESAKQK